MRKLYGDSLRNDAGFVKVIKKVAKKNADLLESRAGRHAPEIKRVAKEVKGTFDKVYEETAEVLEEFLAKCTYREHRVSHRLNNFDWSSVLSIEQRGRRFRRLYKIQKFYSNNLGSDLLSRGYSFALILP